MDLDFGHGFIPRVTSQNYKAVDRCLGPDTLLDAPLDLPWAIVDAPWAERNLAFLASNECLEGFDPVQNRRRPPVRCFMLFLRLRPWCLDSIEPKTAGAPVGPRCP